MCYNNIGPGGKIMKKIVLFGTLFLMACATLKTSSEYITRGNGYLKDGNKQAAIACFNKAVALNPANLEAYEARGAAYFFNGQYDLATADFERVLAEDPYRISAYTAYGSVLAARGDFKNALRVLNLVDKLGTARPETYFARGGVHYMLEQYDLAVADYTRVLQQRPAAEVFNARGSAYSKWGKQDMAQQDFEKAKEGGLPQHLNDYHDLN